MARLLFISQFNSQNYAIALSTSPMSTDEDASSAGRKLTIPLLLVTYSFYVKPWKGGFKMTAEESYKLFRSGTNPSAAGSTKYTPVSRSDYSGSTLAIKQYWKKSVKDFEAAMKSEKSLYSSAPFPSTWPGKRVAGVRAMCNAQGNAIFYSQVGVCGSGVSEVWLQTGSTSYISSSKGNPETSIPKSLPARDSSWFKGRSIPEEMMLVTGASTPPITAFIYGFIQTKLQSKALATNARNAMLCLNKKFSQSKDNKQNLGSDIITTNEKAIKAIQ